MDLGKINSSKRKIGGKKIWDPSRSIVEKLPNEVVLGRGAPRIMATPHWHAQVEVNFVSKGSVTYEMYDAHWTIPEGCCALFWGGLPHRLSDCSENGQMEAIHLPLVHFFRLKLPEFVSETLMGGAALVTQKPILEDQYSVSRWCEYLRSGDPHKRYVATEEILLRLERLAFEPYEIVEVTKSNGTPIEDGGAGNFDKLTQMLDFVTQHFREEIDATAIAESISAHPKYAMSVFKKSTGMTMNNYVKLLRLSYAQSLLMQDNDNVLNIAMRAGFGSLSQFNKCFRSHVGMTPSDFKKQAQARQINYN
ncbi:helix-turn-helix domain-containing protein [Cognatishimia maritima]|uniref:AraC-type DNA-binding protein n=1 Tax=Cognatishimia maritima TaxID=870908 RepID=A0A1M5QJ39_9RHOB|nr:helix-turn-helix domain-containing protein [Cognatishimia maritima]SHH14132.1 AraC-type DNA-binding protein [Cognatishimia maritima]